MECLKSTKNELEKAYEFMIQFVIGGMNLLEKFVEMSKIHSGEKLVFVLKLFWSFVHNF